MFELTEEQRKQILQYLWSRPYGEVATIIAMLASLKSKANGKKNDDDTLKKFMLYAKQHQQPSTGCQHVKHG